MLIIKSNTKFNMLYFSHFRKRLPCFNTNWRHKVSQINRFRISILNAIDDWICNFEFWMNFRCNNAKGIRWIGKAASIIRNSERFTLRWHFRSILCGYFIPGLKRCKYLIQKPPIIIITNLFISSLFTFSCLSPIHSWKNTIFPIQVSANYFVGPWKHSNCDKKTLQTLNNVFKWVRSSVMTVRFSIDVVRDSRCATNIRMRQMDNCDLKIVTDYWLCTKENSIHNDWKNQVLWNVLVRRMIDVYFIPKLSFERSQNMMIKKKPKKPHKSLIKKERLQRKLSFRILFTFIY